MEYSNKMGLGVGGNNSPGKRVLVYSGISSDVRNLVTRFGIDEVDGKTLVFASLDAAVGACLANRGDHIVVAPGHTETISSATALALDVAGIFIEGIGWGTLKPTFTLNTATTATIAVSAANIKIKNIRFSANFADIVTLFTPTAVNLTLEDCDFVATATNMNFLSIAKTNTTNNSADGLTFVNCKWVEPDAATLYWVSGLGDIDGLTFRNSYANLGVNTNDLPALVNMATGKDLTNLRVIDNDVIRLNDANPLLVVTDTTTANTGIIKGNTIRHADTAGELLATAATNIGFSDNKASAVADASGYLLPAADS